MHEYSLVRALLSQVREAVEQDSPGAAECVRVTEVAVTSGPLSGVEPLLVSQAFETLKHHFSSERIVLVDAVLDLRLTELEAVCDDCHSQFSVARFVFQCPKCQSQVVRIIRGDQFQLTSIEIQEAERTFQNTSVLS